MSRFINELYVIRTQEGKAIQLSKETSWTTINKAKVALKNELQKTVTIRYTEDSVDNAIKLDWIAKFNDVFYILYNGQKLQFNSLIDIVEMYLKDGVYSIEKIKL